jgi:hypothetical protein
MGPFAVGSIVFASLFGGAIVGMAFATALPSHHLNSDSRDAIKLATAIVATLTALAIGLLVASAKTSFDAADTQLRNSVARTVLLDRVMAHYGPEMREARAQLRQFLETSLRQVWGHGGTGSTNPNAVSDDPGIEPVQDKLRAMAPQTEAQRWLLSRALQISGEIAETHWLMFERSEAGFPWPFLTILVFWLVMLFVSFGLLAPRNATVLCIMFFCSLSVASAVFLIVDMDTPFSVLFRSPALRCATPSTILADDRPSPKADNDCWHAASQ